MADKGPEAHGRGWRRFWRCCCTGARTGASAVWACIFDRQCWARVWAGILDLAYVAWVVRVPLIALLVGLLVMSFAPQAQDLMVDLARMPERVVSFMTLVMVWIAVTTYASFLLLGTDRRLLDYSCALQSIDVGRYARFECFRTGMPYVLWGRCRLFAYRCSRPLVF